MGGCRHKVRLSVCLSVVCGSANKMEEQAVYDGIRDKGLFSNRQTGDSTIDATFF